MTLVTGTKLGPYEIVGALGAGGMGEVYRARDTKLGREVALKVLPGEFASDAERMARFEREAKVLASLNHPNIAAIYGFEDSSGAGIPARALVMELVEGQTLAEMISGVGAGLKPAPTDGKGMPIDEALPIAKQICEGLEYAHERGIIHRDLKPANVKITPDGVVKLLDFGLAKALEGETTSGDISSSPTLTHMATQAGIILGTAAYMSPEQAKGKSVDRRADIWAFGCVLYEMLTGKKPFEGETITDILASVVKEAPDWSALPGSTPPSIQRLLDRCLTKDPKQRLRDIGEARITMEETISGVGAGLLPAQAKVHGGHPQGSPLRRALPWAMALLVVLLLGLAGGFYLHRVPSSPSLHVAINLPAGFRLDTGNTSMVFSPDGQHLVLAGSKPGGQQQLWIRSLSGDELQPLAGTDGATYPFYSPDGKYLGFFADGKLKKIEISTGAEATLCDAPNGRGGAWNQSGEIVFAPNYVGGLFEVSASGGTPVKVSNVRGKVYSLRLPHFLPDGRQLLYYAGWALSNVHDPNAGIFCLDLDTKNSKRVSRESSGGLYVAPGFLVFYRGGNLMAQRFDAKSCSTTSDPVLLAENVSFYAPRYTGAFALSSKGMLAYLSSSVALTNQLTVFDSDGKKIGTIGEPLALGNPDVVLSPNGQKVALSVAGSAGKTSLWVYDAASGVGKRLTFGSKFDGAENAAWSPDGKQLAFDVNGGEIIYTQPADGSSPPKPIPTDQAPKTIDSWSPDGKFLAIDPEFSEGVRIWIQPMTGNQKPYAIHSATAWEVGAAFSPNGRWLAYASNETGRYEVYVVPFPGPGGKFQISSNGGQLPEWLKGGSELAFIDQNSKLNVVDVQTSKDQLEFGQARTLFGGRALPALPGTLGGAEGGAPVYMTSDGKRIILPVPVNINAQTPLMLETDWMAELKQK